MIDTGAGVIDADYRGEVKVLLFNLSQTDFEGEPSPERHPEQRSTLSRTSCPRLSFEQ